MPVSAPTPHIMGKRGKMPPPISFTKEFSLERHYHKKAPRKMHHEKNTIKKTQSKKTTNKTLIRNYVAKMFYRIKVFKRIIVLMHSIKMSLLDLCSRSLNIGSDDICSNWIVSAKWLKTIRAAAAAAEGKQIPIADDVAAVLCPALAMSVTCNVYLVCAALKLVILTFKLFQFVDVLIPKGAVEGFKYLNVYSNFLLILKSSLHAGVLLIYNTRLRHIIITLVKAWIPRGLLRRSDSDEWESQVNEDQAAEAEPDSKKISLDPTED